MTTVRKPVQGYSRIDALRLGALVVSILTLIALDQLRGLSCPADLLNMNERSLEEEDEKHVQPWHEDPLPDEMKFNYTPSLLDRTIPLVLMKNGIPLTDHYKFPHRHFEGECSCLNPKSSVECCQRYDSI